MIQHDGEKPRTEFPSDLVVEWYVENDAARYKRLSVVGVPSLKEEVRSSGYPRSRSPEPREYKEVPTHAVVCLVLEVPLPQLESITNQARTSSKLRPGTPYLMAAAEAADDAASFRDRIAALELLVKKLQLEVLDEAHTLDSYDKAIDGAEDRLDETIWNRMPDLRGFLNHRPSRAEIGIRHAERAKRRLGELQAEASNEVKRMHLALDEKRADVAAKLLAGLPDGDW